MLIIIAGLFIAVLVAKGFAGDLQALRAGLELVATLLAVLFFRTAAGAFVALQSLKDPEQESALIVGARVLS